MAEEELTYLAVEEILLQAMAYSADATFITMIDVLVDVITPELAYTAIVGGCTLTTLGTSVGRLLWMTAKHTKHVLGQFPR